MMQTGTTSKRLLAGLVAILFMSLPCRAQTAAASQPGIIVFMTDFGIANDSVAICKGVMLQIAPDARVIDITHLVTPFSIADGARFLAGTTPYYPRGTVFVVVVDPGVGSLRKAIVAKSKLGQYFVLPDNGLITPVQDRDGLEGVREITNRSWMLGSGVSSTFHGRDIFSPVGAHLARGENWEDAGPALRVQDLVRLKQPPAEVSAGGIKGTVIALDDPFGNLITNVSGEQFRALGYALGDPVKINLNDRQFELPYAKTFSDVATGKPLLYVDSRGRLSVALNQGNFADVYKIAPPASISIPSKK